MPDPMVYEVATLMDFDGVRLAVGVDHTTVTISSGGRLWARLSRAPLDALTAALQNAAARADDYKPDPPDNEPDS